MNTKNLKIYGNASTHLQLSDIAERIYAETDPCIIAEHETDNGYRYSICMDSMDGFQGDYSEAEVSAFLESLADEFE